MTQINEFYPNRLGIAYWILIDAKGRKNKRTIVYGGH